MTEQLYIGEEEGQSYLIYDGMDGLAFIRIPHILRFRLAFYDEDFKKIKSEDKSSKADFILAEVVAGIGPWQERAVPYRYQFLPLLLESGGERIISYAPRLVDSRFFLIKLPDYSAFSVKEP